LVTGSATGIGEAVCRRFAEEGAAVIVTDSDTDGAIAVADSIVMSGGRAEAMTLDVTDIEHWSVVMEKAIASYQAVDILVNNAGIGIMSSIEDCTLNEWRQTQAVNGEGVFLGAKMAVERMKVSGGSIINISSVQGMVGDANAPAYNYSKRGRQSAYQVSCPSLCRTGIFDQSEFCSSRFHRDKNGRGRLGSAWK